MPYSRPGVGTHLTNDSGGSIRHGAPVAFNGIAGVAVKQKSVPWSQGLAGQDMIAPGEQFWCITDGIVQVDNVAGFAKGDAVYVAAPATANGETTFALTETAAGGTKFGRVVEAVGDGRGVPDGKVRIDLDKKDSF